MKKFVFTLLALILTAFTFLLTTEHAIGQPVIGEPAPDFEVVDAHGNVHSLSDYEGEFVILEWLNHGCPFVQKHYNGENMQALQERYTDQGVVWLSVISSAPGTQGYLEPEEAQEVTREKGAHPTAVLLDPEGTMGRAYDARVTPQMYVINPEGILLYNGAIDDKPTARLRDLDGAHSYLVAAMESALNGEEIEVKTTTPYGCTVKYRD